MPRIGSVRVAPASEYEEGSTQWVVEEFTYTQYRSEEPTWVVPAWEERGCMLDDRYATKAEAESAMEEYVRYW